ncbi:MAG: hypothetical protein QM796_15400 [Chthoniobacteraceae bacterium]
MLETEGWRYSSDTGWSDWDIQIYGNLWWGVVARTVTEYHGGPKCLTRVRLHYKPVFTTVLTNVLAIGVVLYNLIFVKSIGLVFEGFCALYLVFLISLFWRGFRLKRRVAELMTAAASRSGLTRVFGQKAKPAPPA